MPGEQGRKVSYTSPEPARAEICLFGVTILSTLEKPSSPIISKVQKCKTMPSNHIFFP